jgi:hypothetical protein
MLWIRNTSLDYKVTSTPENYVTSAFAAPLYRRDGHNGNFGRRGHSGRSDFWSFWLFWSLQLSDYSVCPVATISANKRKSRKAKSTEKIAARRLLVVQLADVILL